MIVRMEQRADLPAIHAVHAVSFPTDGEARLVDALRAAERLTISLVAEEEGALVGHVAFSPVYVGESESDDATGGAAGLGLAPVAVLPDFRRRGVAERLVRTGLEIAERDGYGLVVVLGDPAYYRRFGFRPAAQWDLRDEYGGGDAFQAMARAGAIPSGGGLVRYDQAFSALAAEG